MLTRSAVPDDTTAILEFWERVAHGRSVSDNEAAVAALLRHPTSRCLVAESEDGTIIGSLVVGWDGWRLSLYRLAVEPDRRRQGVAAALLADAARFAAEVGAVRLDAMVDDGNDDGDRFWTAQGFRPNPRYTRFERTVHSYGPTPMRISTW